MPGPEATDLQLGEFDLIAAIRKRTSTSDRVKIGIGDDCASIGWPAPAELLVTTDMLMDGRHFRLGEATPEQVGYKCLAVNLSDIAAMAGEALAAVVSVALPRSNAQEIALGLHRGMLSLINEFGVDLIGGDTNVWDGPLVVSVTAIGRTTTRGAVRRSGARPGDRIFVTGPLGGSLAGRHLAPRPRIAEALAIHQCVAIHAMIDISDGLASDLSHILEESGGLGAILTASAIPIHPDAEVMAAKDGRSSLEHALTDGEDFELCLTLGPEDAEKLEDRQSLKAAGFRLHCIGVVTEMGGLSVLHPGADQAEPWTQKGFDHMKS